LARIFPQNLPLNAHSVSHLTQRLFSAIPGENTTSEISLFYPMRYDCLINIPRKNTFVHISDT